MTPWTPPATDGPPAETAQAWCLRLQSGGATPAELAQLRGWLDANASHRAAFERANEVWHGMESLGTTMAQLYGERSIESRAAQRHDEDLDQLRQRTPARVRILPGVFAAAAAMAFVSLSPLVSYWSVDVRTAVGEVVRTKLPDGTTAWLDTDSAVELHFTENERRVELVRGQVWFDVRADRHRPFIVQALDGSVTDIGTLFGVRREGRRVNVDVARGAVRIDWRAQLLSLEAGQSGQFGDETPLRGPWQFDPDRMAWQSGRLVFDGQPLREVLAEMDRYRPGRIVLLSQDAAQRPVSAMLSLDDLDAGLDALATTQHIRITRLTDYLVVVTDAGENNHTSEVR